MRNLQMDVRSCPQQVWAVYGQFYRYRLSFTDIHMAFAGCLSGFTDIVQLFLVLATYCMVLGPIPSTKHLIERTLTHLSP